MDQTFPENDNFVM